MYKTMTQKCAEMQLLFHVFDKSKKTFFVT